jgi:hypothetical protein
MKIHRAAASLPYNNKYNNNNNNTSIIITNNIGTLIFSIRKGVSFAFYL